MSKEIWRDCRQWKNFMKMDNGCNAPIPQFEPWTNIGVQLLAGNTPSTIWPPSCRKTKKQKYRKQEHHQSMSRLASRGKNIWDAAGDGDVARVKQLINDFGDDVNRKDSHVCSQPGFCTSIQENYWLPCVCIIYSNREEHHCTGRYATGIRQSLSCWLNVGPMWMHHPIVYVWCIETHSLCELVFKDIVIWWYDGKPLGQKCSMPWSWMWQHLLSKVPKQA